MRKRNKSVTELVSHEVAQKEFNRRQSRAYDEGIQDAKAWRRFWQARAAEEQMRDEGDMLVRPVMTWRVLLRAGVVALIVYGLLTVALVLFG